MQYMVFGKVYGKPSQNTCTIVKESAQMRHISTIEPPSSGNTMVCFECVSSGKECSACSRKIKSGEKVARPHYPAIAPYSGPPEKIQNGERTVAGGVYFCKECFEGAAQSVGLNYTI